MGSEVSRAVIRVSLGVGCGISSSTWLPVSIKVTFSYFLLDSKLVHSYFLLEADSLSRGLEMRISNRRGYTWKSWIILAPLSSASLIAISRTMDYRHHSTDIIAGGVIGILVAWFSYRQYYPVRLDLFTPHLAKSET